MGVMIACSPSTGSSLLRRLLNRHSAIFCGPESSLLSKKELYVDWNKYKGRLKSNAFIKLKEAGWHHFRGITINNEFGISEEELDKLIDSSPTFQIFIDDFFKRNTQEKGKTIWIEKTPSNAFTAELFLNSFESSKLIHITRNPYDAISSLVNRGMNVFDAVAVYLLNTCQLIQSDSHESYCLVKYENLVSDPKAELTAVLDFLSLPFESQMLINNDQFLSDNYMEGWNYKETDPIGRVSLNRFSKMPARVQNETLEVCSLLRSSIHTEVSSIDDICAKQGYASLRKESSESKLQHLKMQLLFDKMKRTISMRNFPIWNYPLYIGDE